MEKIQLDNSDVISFHNYDPTPEFEKRIQWLERYKRPILCTEYMARGNGSTFESSLPVAKKYKVAAINWGLVAGKTQTYLPWDSWKRPYTDREPSIWFHEVFRTDGTPYKPEEVEFIRAIAVSGLALDPRRGQKPPSTLMGVGMARPWADFESADRLQPVSGKSCGAEAPRRMNSAPRLRPGLSLARGENPNERAFSFSTCKSLIPRTTTKSVFWFGHTDTGCQAAAANSPRRCSSDLRRRMLTQPRTWPFSTIGRGEAATSDAF